MPSTPPDAGRPTHMPAVHPGLVSPIRPPAKGAHGSSFSSSGGAAPGPVGGGAPGPVGQQQQQASPAFGWAGYSTFRTPDAAGHGMPAPAGQGGGGVGFDGLTTPTTAGHPRTPTTGQMRGLGLEVEPGAGVEVEVGLLLKGVGVEV